MTGYRWGVLLAMAGLLLGAGPAVAQDEMITAKGARVVTETPAQSEQLSRLQAIRADRGGTISELMGQWAPAKGASQLETALRAASPGKLLQVSGAGSFQEVERILLGQAAGAPFDNAVPNTLGDTTQDYVFTPVTPCRIFDTRNAGGVITALTSREFYVYGTAGDIAPQGGNAAGCPAPTGKGEPRGVHLNLTVVPVGAQGNVRVYPANEATPNASAINFKLGTNIANALTVKTFVSFGPREIEVYVDVSDAHVLADVMGYYYDAPTASFMAKLSANQPLANLTETTVIFNSENHDTGGEYNNATGIFTVPETGLYNVSCHLEFGPNLANLARVNIYLKRNATDLAVTFGGTNASDDYVPRMLTGTWQLTAGDTIRCNGFVNSSTTAIAFSTSFFSATRVR